jgi:hypothetical protein
VGAALLLLPTLAVDGLVGPYVDGKAWLLVLLAAVAGVAWLWNPTRPRPTPPPNRVERAARIALLAYLGAVLLSAGTSIAPGLSLWGEFGRGQGAVTIAAAALVGALVWTQRGSAVRPLVDLALLGALPVCLVAIGQALGWDPLPATQFDPATAGLRVRSTLGTHLFLGSYLALLAPLTLGRLGAALGRADADSTDQGHRSPDPRMWWWGAAWVLGAIGALALAGVWPPLAWALAPLGVLVATGWLRASGDAPAPDSIARIGMITALLVLEVAVAILSRARGPFLGLLVALAVTGLGLLVVGRKWRGLAGAVGAALGVGALLLLLNVPGSLLEPLRTLPALSRFAHLAETRPGSPGWVRLQIWASILQGWRQQLEGTAILPDSSPLLRSLLGYGPETQSTTIEPLVRPRLGTAQVLAGQRWIQYFIDRAHNDPLDHLLTGGLLGLGAWLGAVGGIIALGVSRLRSLPQDAEEVALRLGALGGIVGHLVETQVGVETPVSRTVFALAAGLLTMPAWTRTPGSAGPGIRHGRRTRGLLQVGAAAAAGMAALGATGWLLASGWFATGSRAWATGDVQAARRAFQRASAVAPWLARPADAAAEAALTLASQEPDPRRRRTLLDEAARSLDRARRAARPTGEHWALRGQVAQAEAMAGRPEKLEEAVRAYTEAVRVRPTDGRLHALRGLALLEAGDPAGARAAAAQAVATAPDAWLGWAVLARSARRLGDQALAEEAAGRARALAPARAQALLDRLTP